MAVPGISNRPTTYPPIRQSFLRERQSARRPLRTSRPLLGNPRGDHPRPLRLVVPRDHPVVETEHDVRDGEVVVAGARDPLERRAPIVADVAGRPALERWQLG